MKQHTKQPESHCAPNATECKLHDPKRQTGTLDDSSTTEPEGAQRRPQIASGKTQQTQSTTPQNTQAVCLQHPHYKHRQVGRPAGSGSRMKHRNKASLWEHHFCAPTRIRKMYCPVEVRVHLVCRSKITFKQDKTDKHPSLKWQPNMHSVLTPETRVYSTYSLVFFHFPLFTPHCISLLIQLKSKVYICLAESAKC